MKSVALKEKEARVAAQKRKDVRAAALKRKEKVRSAKLVVMVSYRLLPIL